MGQWVKVGNRAINMDQVTDVEMATGSSDVYVHLAVAEADDTSDTGTVELYLSGAEAAALRWWIATQAMDLLAYHAADKERAAYLAAHAALPAPVLTDAPATTSDGVELPF